MPSHGLKADLELLTLVITAGIAAYLFTDQVVSNALFTGLISILFFLTGLQINSKLMRKTVLKKNQILLGLATVFIFTPALAIVFGNIFPGFKEVILAIGFSAAAVGSTKIWSNMTNSDGELAAKIGIISIFASAFFVPILILVSGLDIDLELLFKNALIPLTALFLGVATRGVGNSFVEDLRLHFSKLSFWLIVLITGIQTQILLEAEGFSILYTFGYAALIFTAFSFACFGLGYFTGRLSDLYEKEARALGFASGSKNIAVAFLIALHIDGLAVALVGLYYFVRQISGVFIVDLMVHGEFRTLKRILLKGSSPLSKFRVNT